jgi:UPF0716 protein FxsA
VLPSFRLAFLLVFVAFPLVEIMLLIKAGATIGFWPTVGLLFAAAFLGMVVIRNQGLTMVSRVLSAVNEGKMPIEPMLDGYARVVAGSLLIVPGFLSDAIGLVLLVPPLRAWCIRRTMSGFRRTEPRAPDPRTPSRPTVIEGTFERIDDETPRKPGASGNDE